MNHRENESLGNYTGGFPGLSKGAPEAVPPKENSLSADGYSAEPSAAWLGIFAKRPVPGRVKTRLAAETSDRWAAAVAAALVSDSLDAFSSLPCHRVLLVDPPDAVSEMRTLAAGRYAIIPQVQGHLGQRMQRFVEQAIVEGASRIVLLGSDSPHLPAYLVVEAFERLKTDDVVLGPAEDGGYYLLGCGRRIPPVFDGINWGSPDVLDATLRRLPPSQWRVSTLRPWYDIDSLTDWKRLIEQLSQSGATPNPTRLIAIRRLLAMPDQQKHNS